MMHAAIHGRLGKDPSLIQTKTGKAMTTASVAVDVSQRDSEATLWVRVICFGRLADQLARHTKGDTLNAAGRLELSKWTADDGAERESLQLIADALVSARTVRPAGRSRSKPATPSTGAPAPLDDALPF